MFIRNSLLIVLVAGAVALTVACGGGSEDKGRTIEVKAEQIKFVPADISVLAGETVTLRLKNVDDMAHDLEVKGLKAEIVSGGGHGGGHDGGNMMAGTVAVHTDKKKSGSVTFVAKDKGTYEIWCTISGHKELGMVGKLVVT
jgi:plastocyanin